MKRIKEDAREFEALDVETLVVFGYDPDGRLPDPRRIENVGTYGEGGLRVRSVIA